MYDRDRIQRLKERVIERVIKSKPYKEIVSKGRNLCTRVKLLYQTIIEVLLATVLLFVVSLSPPVAGFLNRNSGVLEVESSIVIASVVLFFTIESVELEKKKIRPRITFQRPKKYGDQLIIPIKNIGLGPAYYIHIYLYEVNYEVNKEEAELIKYIEYLPPNQCAEISLPVDLLKKANNKKDVEISQHYQVSYYGPLGDTQSEEKDIGDEWLLEFDKLKPYLENNPRTISDDLEIRI